MWSSEVEALSIWKWDKPGCLDDLHTVESTTQSQARVQVGKVEFRDMGQEGDNSLL